MTTNESAREIDRRVRKGLRIIGSLDRNAIPSLPENGQQAVPQKPVGEKNEPEHQRVYRTTLGSTSL